MYTPTAKQTLKSILTFSAIFILFISTSIASTSADLPVKFVRFEAKQIGDMVLLRWLTDSEINNDFFTVERSEDGLNWQPLGDIAATATTPGGETYEYYDNDPVEGESIYRIRQNDLNGVYDYSFEISMTFSNFADIEVQLEVFPNPVTTTTFNVSSEFDLSFTTVKLIDIAGKEIGISLNINDTEMTVTPEKIIPGMYFLILQVGPKTITKKLKIE